MVSAIMRSFNVVLIWVIGSARATALTTTSLVVSERDPPLYVSRLPPCPPDTHIHSAQLNLEVPEHDFNEAEGKIIIG